MRTFNRGRFSNETPRKMRSIYQRYFDCLEVAAVRVGITLECTECKNRNYRTNKNKKNDPDRIEMQKFCKTCKTHTPHKETR